MKRLLLILLLAGCDKNEMVEVSNARKWEEANKAVAACKGEVTVSTSVGMEGYIDSITVWCRP